MKITVLALILVSAIGRADLNSNTYSICPGCELTSVTAHIYDKICLDCYETAIADVLYEVAKVQETKKDKQEIKLRTATLTNCSDAEFCSKNLKGSASVVIESKDLTQENPPEQVAAQFKIAGVKTLVSCYVQYQETRDGLWDTTNSESLNLVCYPFLGNFRNVNFVMKFQRNL